MTTLTKRQARTIAKARRSAPLFAGVADDELLESLRPVRAKPRQVVPTRDRGTEPMDTEIEFTYPALADRRCIRDAQIVAEAEAGLRPDDDIVARAFDRLIEAEMPLNTVRPLVPMPKRIFANPRLREAVQIRRVNAGYTPDHPMDGRYKLWARRRGKLLCYRVANTGA